MKHRLKSNIGRINSLDDLQSEIVRLKTKLQQTEEGINSNYHNILNAFSLSNIIKTVTQEIAITSKAFSIGKMLLGKVKKKKKKTQEKEDKNI
jgi:hypothetical protein